MGTTDVPHFSDDADIQKPFLIISNRNGKPVKIALTGEQLDRAQKALELIIPEAVEDLLI